MRVDPLVSPPDEPPDPRVFRPPPQFLDPDPAAEGRLVPQLRAAAALRDPTIILAWSATEFLRAARAGAPRDRVALLQLATALADLAVTGRVAYAAFSAGLNLVAVEGATRLRVEAQVGAPPATDAEIAAATTLALDRAFAVAWALRGPAAQRPALRARLGWIAVSAEDDTPHRPVNMPAPPYEQFEVRVRTPVAGGEIPLWTRYFIANAIEPFAAPVPVAARTPPNNPVPNVPAGHQVLIFLHGHSSGAEEALDIVPHLINQGLRRGSPLSVISLDLPNNGYSETFDHRLVAPADATTFPYLPTDNDPIAVPLLDFIEDFIVAFVDAVDDAMVLNGMTPIKQRIVGVIGGSLGGNLGLRLGRRRNAPPWLARGAIVSWSPASIWKAKVKFSPEREGPRYSRDMYSEPEAGDSRARYFQEVYDRNPLGEILKRQSAYWYRKGLPAAALHIAMSRIARHEIYNTYYRMWHWRVACEQLIFSHAENEVYGDETTPLRYLQNTVRTLLVAGKVDDYTYTGIYTGVKSVGRAMTRTPGRLLLLRDTGHSIHIERPQFLAREIVSFVLAGSMQIRCVTRRAGSILRVGGVNRTLDVPFDLTQQECIAAIANGDEFFVVDDQGNVAAVIVGQMRTEPGPGGAVRYFLKTEADGLEPNNLASLPAC